MTGWPNPPVWEPRSGERVVFMNRDYSALVSEVDYDRVAQFRWTASFDRLKGRMYASRFVWTEGKRQKIYMHRFITDAPPGILVDHRAAGTLHNTLRNTRSNLRLVTYHDNTHNRDSPPNQTGYRGVSRHGVASFKARMSWRGEDMYLGCFKDAEDAARAYDAKSIELLGEFAWTNFDYDEPGLSPDIPFPEVGSRVLMDAI